MVEDEDRRPRRPQVLLAVHVQTDSGKGERRLGPGADREVCGRPPAAREQAQAHPGRHRPAQAGQRGARADDRYRSGAAPALEAVGLPAPLARELGQAAVGVERPRPPDRLEVGEVLLAVAVRVALVEVDALLLGEAPHGVGLAGAPQHGAGQLSGREPVDHFDLRAEQVVDAELAGERRDLERRG